MSVRCSRARNSEDGKSNSIGYFCCSLQALDAFVAHLAEARIAEPRAFGLASRQRLLVRTEIIARSFSASAA
jgi:hypothetical protein